jgi:response regulator RpfG family c-di-GMP phosphodiesterase
MQRNMNKLKGQIILIDDEQYEEDFLNNCLAELNYEVEVKYFGTPADAFNYLKVCNEDIFLIISDLHMPGMNGIELKEKIDNDPDTKLKSIPFVFATTAPVKEGIIEAYKHNIQGFFKKPVDLNELKSVISVIVRYWIINLHPNKKVT